MRQAAVLQAAVQLLNVVCWCCAVCAADSADGFPKAGDGSFEAGLTAGKGKVRNHGEGAGTTGGGASNCARGRSPSWADQARHVVADGVDCKAHITVATGNFNFTVLLRHTACEP